MDKFFKRLNVYRTCDLDKAQRMQGSALIAVLAIVAIAAILSAGILTRIKTDILRTQQIQLHSQLLLDSDGAILWAKTALKEDWDHFIKTNQPTDWSKIRWQQNDSTHSILASIEDAQARFNLNNLRDPTRSQSFVSLLRAVDPTLSTENATLLTKNIQAWLDASSRSNPTTKMIYLQQKPPYLPAGQLFVHPNELLLVDGINSVLFKKLQPNIVALPQTTPVNINTANAFVLMTLGNGMSFENATKLILQRQELGFYKTSEQFLSTPGAQSAQVTANQISLTSDYFILHTTITTKNEKIIVDNLLKRQNDNGKIHIIRLWQQIAYQGNS